MKKQTRLSKEMAETKKDMEKEGLYDYSELFALGQAIVNLKNMKKKKEKGRL